MFAAWYSSGDQPMPKPGMSRPLLTTSIVVRDLGSGGGGGGGGSGG